MTEPRKVGTLGTLAEIAGHGLTPRNYRLGTLGTLGTGVFPSRVRAGIFPCSQFIWKKQGVPSVPSVPGV